MSAQPQILSGLNTIMGSFDLYLFDVWGTIYDGRAAFPGVVNLLNGLRRQGKRVVLLSNSPQLRKTVAARMNRIGIGPDCYDAIVTSGGETHDALCSGVVPEMAPFAGRVLQTGSARFPDALPEHRFPVAASVEEADWILNAGPSGPNETVEDYEDLLQAAFRRNLPMLCANPDRIVFHGGVRQICAGALAERYADLGGHVHEIGKPHPAVFERCCALFSGIAATRVVMIGDNLETDIRGANQAGFAAILIASGVHELVDGTGAIDLAGLERLQHACGANADFALPRLTW